MNMKRTIVPILCLPLMVLSLVVPKGLAKDKVPFEAVFQGLCEDNELCEQLCFNLHDGTFECDCQPGYKLDSNGYSCSKMNLTSQSDPSLLYKKEASFVAVLEDESDEEYEDYPPGDEEDYQEEERKEEDDYQADDSSNFINKNDYEYQGDESSSSSTSSLKERKDPKKGGKLDELFGSEFEKYSYSEKELLRNKLKYPYIYSGELDAEDDGEEQSGDGDYNRRKNEVDFDLHQDEEEATMVEPLNSDDEDENLFSGSGDHSGDTPPGVPLTSPGPNLEQKVPSRVPNLEATESLTPMCSLDCGTLGKCVDDKMSKGPPQLRQRCQCPVGREGTGCSSVSQMNHARFHGNSWAAFAPLREAYRDVQLTVEFKPTTDSGIILVSGENDDLDGDFMAATMVDGFIHFKWDCGSGAGSVKSPDKVALNEWNRITVYRHRWDVWLQLNNGHHVQGRSEGLFSRITFREPLYVGGTYNMTSLIPRLGVSGGFEGCIKKLQVNNHFYKFYKNTDQEQSTAFDYSPMDGWDIDECSGKGCNEMECQHGGQCISVSATSSTDDDIKFLSSSKPTVDDEKDDYSDDRYPSCLCPLGFDGKFCENQLNLEVPSFNGSSLLMFPPLRNSLLSWLEINIVFKPSSTEGVILFAGHRTDGSGDFMSISLSHAHVLVNIDLGSGPLMLRSLYPVQPNLWHTVKISRTGRRTWIYVDDQLPVEGMTPGAFTMLSLAQPLVLGGLPSLNFPPAILPDTSNFMGCIQKLSINHRQLHLVSAASAGINIGSCEHPCSSHPCDNGGICEPIDESYSCRCPLGYNDPHCRSQVVTQVATPAFSGRSFLKYNIPEILKRLTGDKLHLWMRFRATAEDGMLFWIGSEELEDAETSSSLPSSLGDFLSLELSKGRIVLRYNLGSGIAHLTYNSSVSVANEQWHTLKLIRFEREAHLTIDEGPLQAVKSPGDLIQLNVDSPLYIGGIETYRSIGGALTPGLKGCVADLILATDYHVDLMNQAESGQNIDYC